MSHFRSLLVASSLACGLAGCATQSSILRADNHKLNQTLTDLREDRREQDLKLRDLQHQLDQLRADHATAAVSIVPTLPVEVIGGAPQAPQLAAGQRLVGVADDGAEIVYEGDAAAGKTAVLDDDPPSTVPDVPAALPRHHGRAGALPVAIGDVPAIADAGDRAPDRADVGRRPVAARGSHAHVRSGELVSPVNEAAEQEYRSAVDLLKAGKHDDAIAALRAFIVHYPKDDYADNAQYWLGEAFYAQKDYTKALVEFRATIETYPRGNKVPDALLKVGYCYQALGQADKSRAVLEQVVNLYPKTEPAALATKRLETP